MPHPHQTVEAGAYDHIGEKIQHPGGRKEDLAVGRDDHHHRTEEPAQGQKPE